MLTHGFAEFYRKLGYQMTPALDAALQEFGNRLLRRPPASPGTSWLPRLGGSSGWTYWCQILISPYLAAGYTDSETLECCTPAVGSRLTPFAAVPGVDDFWLMDEGGRVFYATDLSWVGLIGQSIDEAIEDFFSGDGGRMEIFAIDDTDDT